MVDIKTTHNYNCDLNTGPCDAELRTPLMYQDALADEFAVAVYRGDDPVDLTGMTVHGSVYFSTTRQTRSLDGSVDGHYASVTLDADCYKLPGLVCITIQLETAGGVRHTVLKVDGLVVRTRSEALLSGGPLPSLAELVEMIKNLTGDGTPAIPEYVETEAMAVLDKVIAAQGSRTFTLAAITDMHYGSSDYIDGVIHAVQGMRHISDRIKLDAVAVLGDYTDEHQMDTDTAVHDLEECNALLDSLRHNINLRLKGNHDHRPNAAPQIYRYISAYSDGVVWGSRIGGYYFRDFADYKLRVVCLNTTEVARSNLSVSDAQYQWFAGALDLSGKADAAQWGLLLLSHHPLDFTVSDGKYRFGHIINAYQTGTSWTDGTVSCDYEGKNAAPIIANLHGHLHNLLTDKLYVGVPGSSVQTNVTRMCIPAARVDYVNHYASPWQESAWYEKTMNSAEDTSFCICCIDLDARSVKVYCYGAGYDRTLTYEGNGSTSGGESGGGSDTPTTVDNWLPISTDASGNIYNSVGWKANTRYSASSNAEADYTGIYLSGYIPVEQGSVVKLENVGLATTSDSARVNVVVFGTDMTTAWEAANVETLCNRFGAVLAADGVTVESFVIPDEGTHYIRINATYLGADSVVQVQ